MPLAFKLIASVRQLDTLRLEKDATASQPSHATLCDPGEIPAKLRAAHDRNDETLERIYLGRRFKNDTERLEKLFALYTEMRAKGTATAAKPAPRRKKADATEPKPTRIPPTNRWFSPNPFYSTQRSLVFIVVGQSRFTLTFCLI